MSRTRSRTIKLLDQQYSKAVRARDKYTCVYPSCGKTYPENSNGLHCSHYFSRRYMGTRWDMENLDSLCFGHHRLVEGDKQGWYTDFKRKQLGEEGLEKLRIRAYAITKFSILELDLMLKDATGEWKKN